MEDYIRYHIHDDTSNCNGYSDSCTSYKDYIKLVKKSKSNAIAFSNHGGIYDWVKKKQECDKAKIKYIHGVELYMCTKLENDERGYHIGLYAKNFDGVKELNSLVSLATSKGIKEDKTDRHFYFNPRLSIEEVMNTSSNIIITTACLASILWECKYTKKTENLTEKEIQEQNNNWLVNRDIFLKWLSKNNERCFLEIQYHNNIHQIEFNQLLYKWSKEYNIPLIAGTDTHSSNAYKAECRKILQKSKDSYYGEEDEFDLTWKTLDELILAFENQNALPKEIYLEAIDNTNKFANLVEDFKLDKSFKYPNLYGDKVTELFRNTIITKYKNKVKNKVIDGKNPRYKNDIKEEFDTFKKQGMESFLLFMSELADYCNDNDIPYGFNRGSVGGSTIAYILDIIDLDPVVWNTVFSRFCNADRISLGDIDVDFAPKDRPKVYEYIIKRFGTKNTAYIAQFGTLKDRGTIDVLTKGLDYDDLDAVAKIKDEFEKIFAQYTEIIQAEVNTEELDLESSTIDFDNHNVYVNQIRNQKATIKANKLYQEFINLKDFNKDLFYYFDGIKGTIISKGNHPSGIIGSPITLQDNLGVFYRDGDENIPISTCAMKAVDSINFVKFDILGLKTVGIMKDTYKYIGSHYLKSHEIDWNDKKVWDDMIKSQIGVFQFEGDFAFALLKDFKPQKINDMSLVNACLRPSGKSYRERLIAREFNNNPSKEIDDLLSDNNGFLVYQEDTIKFLTDICGFSGALADTTRRAIGKKLQEELKQQLPQILDGYCNVSKQPREVAEEEAKAFLQIIEDSSEYQFGYNHSTGYSMNGYACVRLRAYHPLEFTTAYLNNADNKEDIQMGTELARERNIKIKPIEFGQSIDKYTFDKTTNTIYKGIESIKYCNAKIAHELYELRNNKYITFAELLKDIIEKTSVDSRQLKILTGLGFFRKYGKNKKLLNYVDVFSNFNGRKQIKKSELEKLGLTEELIKRYSNKETEALYKEIDIIGLISELTDNIEDASLSVKEQVKFEKDYLEYVIYTNPKVNEKFYIVIEYTTYNDKRKPYVTLKHIQTGDEIKTKIKDPQVFVENSFKLYDVLKVNEWKQQYKTKNIGGKWQKTNELEDILYSYEVY
jgi:DNA polymerase-3 subunit alpha